LNSRAAVFIDGAYLSKLLELDYGGTRIDYEKFSDAICRKRERLRTYYYNCMPFQGNPPTGEESVRYARMDKFISRLMRLPRFQVRFGKLGRIGNEFVQKRVDILLAVELVRLSWPKGIGTAILGTGDSDFVPAVEAAKDAGVLIQLWYSRSAIHNELLDAVDEYFPITQELIDSVTLH